MLHPSMNDRLLANLQTWYVEERTIRDNPDEYSDIYTTRLNELRKDIMHAERMVQNAFKDGKYALRRCQVWTHGLPMYDDAADLGRDSDTVVESPITRRTGSHLRVKLPRR